MSVDNPVLDDESYTYDAVGNRLTAADVSGTWNYNANNELLGFADVEYEYDDNGNLTELRVGGVVVWTYVYDAANRLVHVEDGTGTISADYYYDPFGRRLWKDVGGTKTYFFYSNEGLIGEYDASGNEIKTYGYKPDSTWTTDPLFMKQGTDYYFYQNDHLGTPQKLVAMNGAVVWSAQYNAFGEADVQVETVTNNLRFPGQYADAETGLHYNRYRYYDPKIGRYIQADPVGFVSGDVNLYGYVENSPIGRVDIYGLMCKDAIQNGTLEYSCKCGWIDWGHTSVTNVTGFDMGPLWGEDGLYTGWAHSPEGGRLIRAGQLMSVDEVIVGGIWGFYFVSEEVFKDGELQKEVGLAIFQHATWGFETYQGAQFFFQIDPRAAASSFSPDDLPSDKIAFYQAVKKYEGEEVIKDEDLKKYFQDRCGAVGKEASEKVWEQAFGHYFLHAGPDDLQCVPMDEMHKEWTPKNYNQYCGECSETMEWPEELDMIMADPGEYWREWDEVRDGPIPEEAKELLSQSIHPLFEWVWERPKYNPNVVHGILVPKGSKKVQDTLEKLKKQ